MVTRETFNKAKQPQSQAPWTALPSLILCRLRLLAQNNQQQVCRCLRRYTKKIHGRV
jgi:hypothetical protein